MNSGASPGFHCFGRSGIGTVLSCQMNQNVRAVEIICLLHLSGPIGLIDRKGSELHGLQDPS